MAIVHLNNAKYIKTESEKIFLEALQEQLDDDFHIFYSIVWFFKDENNKKVHSECDFLIFNPNLGYLVIEVKGGTKIEYDGRSWKIYNRNEYRYLNENPMSQSEASMYYFRDYFKSETGQKFAGIYGAAVAFPFYNIQENLGTQLTKDVVISLKDLKDLKTKILNLFNYYSSNPNLKIMKEQARTFIELINKKVALSIAAGAIIEVKERELEQLNKIQDTILDLLINYNEAFIIGGAGTGKTYIGLKKIKRGLLENKKTLFLSYNQALSSFAKEQVKSDCLTFDKLLVKILGKEKYFDNSLNVFQELVNSNLPQYDLIVVDEAQDFKKGWPEIVRLLLKPGGQLYVFYDKEQNIFEQGWMADFNIKYPAFLLKYNIRNTKEIHNFITKLTGIGTDIIANSINGAKPEMITFNNDFQAQIYLKELILKLIEQELVEPSAITILSDRKKEKTFLKDIDRIKKYYITQDLKTFKGDKTVNYQVIQGFKGLESNIIIYLNYIRNKEKDHGKKTKLYTALSRAKYFLYIINIDYLN